MEARVRLNGRGLGGKWPRPPPQPLIPLEGGPARVGGRAGDTPRCPWVGSPGGRPGREWVHTCASEDTPRTHRRQLIMIICNYQKLRAQCSSPCILYNSEP